MMEPGIFLPYVVLFLAALVGILLVGVLLVGFLHCKETKKGTIMIKILAALVGILLVALIVVPIVPDEYLRADPMGALQEADIFIAFGFGLGRAPDGSETPGESNMEIARWIMENNLERKPTITQEGVYLALKELERSDSSLDIDSWVIRLPHNPSIYVNTYEATLQCWAIMNAMGCHCPALVSHDLQLQRMVWNFEKIGLTEQIIVPPLPTIPFDSNSIHWGTRSRRNWLTWELIVARPIGLIGRQI